MIIAEAGMVTAVGNNCSTSGAAIRAGVTGFRELPFVFDGDALIGAPARTLTANTLGVSLRARLAAFAVADANAVELIRECPVLLALQEAGSGSPSFNSRDFVSKLQAYLRIESPIQAESFEAGPVATFQALARARQLLSTADACVIIAVDSLIDSSVLKLLAQSGRLKTVANPDGLIPGEAAACLVIRRETTSASGPRVRGLGFAHEPRLVGADLPVLGQGLSVAMKQALADAAIGMEDVGFRVSDLTGERYGFADANYALARVLRIRRPILDLVHLMDSLGTVGAAAGACQLAYLRFAFQKGYLPGDVAMCETSSDQGGRAVALVCAH